jgi:DNA repair exonuclease SbcCD ATPase subunit
MEKQSFKDQYTTLVHEYSGTTQYKRKGINELSTWVLIIIVAFCAMVTMVAIPGYQYGSRVYQKYQVRKLAAQYEALVTQLDGNSASSSEKAAALEEEIDQLTTEQQIAVKQADLSSRITLLQKLAEQEAERRAKQADAIRENHKVAQEKLAGLVDEATNLLTDNSTLADSKQEKLQQVIQQAEDYSAYSGSDLAELEADTERLQVLRQALARNVNQLKRGIRAVQQQAERQAREAARQKALAEQRQTQQQALQKAQARYKQALQNYTNTWNRTKKAMDGMANSSKSTNIRLRFANGIKPPRYLKPYQGQSTRLYLSNAKNLESNIEKMNDLRRQAEEQNKQSLLGALGSLLGK